MPANIGTIDRVLRIIVGLAILSLVFVGPKSLWGLVGLIPLGTAVFGFCPAYALFGIRTCQIDREKRV
jgi:ABC-type branched-subunit amino acid transport system permease subunit